MTCYDLRFPELARLLVAAGAEVLVVPAAWVAGPRKVDHWRTLLRARAIENTAFVVGAAQPAPRYSGHSMVVDPRGEVLCEAGEGTKSSVPRCTGTCSRRPGGPIRRWPIGDCSLPPRAPHRAATTSRAPDPVDPGACAGRELLGSTYRHWSPPSWRSAAPGA